TVVVHKNPVHCACALVLTLCLLAVYFLALDAQLVALLQVIVYAGAIVVLFLFVVMLLNLQKESRAMAGALLVGSGAAGGAGLLVNAVNLSFVAFARSLGSMDGQVIVFFFITVAAAEAAVGLAIILSMFRNRETTNADELATLRW